jgi:ribokinase
MKNVDAAPAGSRAFVLANFVQACCWSVTRLPQPGETLVAHDLSIEPGGKGLNVAVGLHRLGVQVQALLGCGQDQAGDALMKLFETEGLSTQAVRRFASASGWGSGWIAADGRNAIAVYPGANLLLTAQDARACQADIEHADLVYGQFETSIPAVEAAFEIAHQAGIPTVLNPSPWAAVSPALMACTQTLLVNEVEAGLLLGFEHEVRLQDQATVMAALPKLFVQWPALSTLVMTLGAQGCWGVQRPVSGQSLVLWHVSAAPVQAVDSVGAGDTFACGYLWASLRKLPFEACLKWGNAGGALMASQRGVLQALPRENNLEQMYHQYMDSVIPSCAV